MTVISLGWLDLCFVTSFREAPRELLFSLRCRTWKNIFSLFIFYSCSATLIVPWEFLWLLLSKSQNVLFFAFCTSSHIWWYISVKDNYFRKKHKQKFQKTHSLRAFHKGLVNYVCFFSSLKENNHTNKEVIPISPCLQKQFCEIIKKQCFLWFNKIHILKGKKKSPNF